MGLKGTSVSHQQLPKQAITCKLAGIEMDTWTAKARFSLSGVVGQWEERRRVPCHPFIEQDVGPLQKGEPNSTTLIQTLPFTMNLSWSGRAEKRQ